MNLVGPTTSVALDDVDRLIVVVPHPDDEALSCGVLLARAAERDVDVCVIAVTDGEAAYPDLDPIELAEVREREQNAALRALGLPDPTVDRLRVPDGEVADHTLAVEAAIRRHLGVRTLVVAPSMYDWHPDHEACGRGAARARHRRAGAWWSSLFWAHHHPERLVASRPDMVRLDADDRHVAARAGAVRCHRSQFTPPGGEPILNDDLVAHLADPFEWYVREST